MTSTICACCLVSPNTYACYQGIAGLSTEECQAVVHNGVGRETLRLYCAAYQALVWNRTASERLQQGVRGVHIGDMVATHDSERAIASEVEAAQYSMTDVLVPLAGVDRYWVIYGRFRVPRSVDNVDEPACVGCKLQYLIRQLTVHLCRGSLYSQSDEHVWRLLRHDNVTIDDLQHAKACGVYVAKTPTHIRKSQTHLPKD